MIIGRMPKNPRKVIHKNLDRLLKGRKICSFSIQVGQEIAGKDPLEYLWEGKEKPAFPEFSATGNMMIGLAIYVEPKKPKRGLRQWVGKVVRRRNEGKRS